MVVMTARAIGGKGGNSGRGYEDNGGDGDDSNDDGGGDGSDDDAKWRQTQQSNIKPTSTARNVVVTTARAMTKAARAVMATTATTTAMKTVTKTATTATTTAATAATMTPNGETHNNQILSRHLRQGTWW